MLAQNRRSFFTAGGVSVAAMTSLGRAPAQTHPTDGFRVCFFTDPHLPPPYSQKEAESYQPNTWIRNAFKSANRHRPDVFVFGGDCVARVDSIYNPDGNLPCSEEAADAQFENWSKVVQENISVPHHTVIGNHDIWMPNVNTPTVAKEKAIKAFEMPSRYYSWKMKGWKFVMLDIFGKDGFNHDPEQQAWFEKEIQGNQPVCVVSHSPIFSVTPYIEAGKTLGDHKKMRQLFLDNPHVRVALSGHMHLIDHVEFDRVTYHCAGAVCGGWWGNKSYKSTPGAYMVLDLHPDGSHHYQTIYWDWSGKEADRLQGA